MILALLILLFAAPPTVAQCDSGGERRSWTDAERSETFRVVRSVCEAQGAAGYVCDALDAVTWRESRGKASVTHTKGRAELGYGAHGISWRFWRKRIPNATPADFCDPRQSALVVLSMWQTFERRGARNLVGLQRGYSGRRFGDESRPHADNRWCSILLKRGVDCTHELEAGDLGRPIQRNEIRALAKAVPWSPPA